MAACAAAGMNAEAIRNLLYSLKKEDFWDPEPWYKTVVAALRLFRGWAGYLKGERFNRLLMKTLPVRNFEELNTPCVIVGCNLSRHKKEVFSNGSIADAVQASGTIPWIFKFKNIDILINNAAVYYGVPMKPFDTISEEEWDRMFNVNVKGMWLCIKAVTPDMKKNGKGKIINISSVTWLMGIPMILHYVTTKAAVVGMTRALCRELGEYNICINSIAPGFTMTEASKTLPGRPPGLNEMIAQQTALGRNEEPEDLVGAALFLASDESDFITGQMLNVDGGCMLH